jgi:MoxR-like ATPase
MNTKLTAIRTALNAKFLERSQVIDGMLTCLLAGEHALLFGLPGTSKSAMTNALCNCISGAEYFQWLLTKFTTPEEVFGPMSLKALEQDRYCRNTAGKLPQAHIAFVDEIFKASSSILNALLTIINEKVYHNDGAPQPVPLISIFGASNELPESAGLDALYDRFLLRYWVDYITGTENFKAMLFGSTEVSNASISLAELAEEQINAASVTFPDAAFDTLLQIKLALESKQIRISDRRWKRIISLLKAYTYLNEDNIVSDDSFPIIIDALWRKPEERSIIADIVHSIVNPVLAQVLTIVDAAQEAAVTVKSLNGAPYAAQAATVTAELRKMEREILKIITQDGVKRERFETYLDQVQALRKEITAKVSKIMGV